MSVCFWPRGLDMGVQTLCTQWETLTSIHMWHAPTHTPFSRLSSEHRKAPTGVWCWFWWLQPFSINTYVDKHVTRQEKFLQDKIVCAVSVRIRNYIIYYCSSIIYCWVFWHVFVHLMLMSHLSVPASFLKGDSWMSQWLYTSRLSNLISFPPLNSCH